MSLTAEKILIKHIFKSFHGHQALIFASNGLTEDGDLKIKIRHNEDKCHGIDVFGSSASCVYILFKVVKMQGCNLKNLKTMN